MQKTTFKLLEQLYIRDSSKCVTCHKFLKKISLDTDFCKRCSQYYFVGFEMKSVELKVSKYRLLLHRLITSFDHAFIFISGVVIIMLTYVKSFVSV